MEDMSEIKVFHQNFKSDFAAVFRFANRDLLPAWPWRMEFAAGTDVGSVPYIASFDGERYENCLPVPEDSNAIMVIFKRHGFGIGILRYELHEDVPSSLFPDGCQSVVSPDCAQIEIYTGKSDDSIYTPEVQAVLTSLFRGPGVNAGGASGQVLGKNSDADFDTAWVGPYPGLIVESTSAAGQGEVFNTALVSKDGKTPGVSSHAEGKSTFAPGNYSHSEGFQTISSGSSSHVEGDKSKSTGIASHAEGGSTEAEGNYAHSEGLRTSATGENSHAEGRETEAFGKNSHAGGVSAKAKGANAFAHGNRVEASGDDQAVFGSYNAPDVNDIFQVGIGTKLAPKNGLSITRDGNVRVNTLQTAGEGITISDELRGEAKIDLYASPEDSINILHTRNNFFFEQGITVVKGPDNAFMGRVVNQDVRMPFYKFQITEDGTYVLGNGLDWELGAALEDGEKSGNYPDIRFIGPKGSMFASIFGPSKVGEYSYTHFPVGGFGFLDGKLMKFTTEIIFERNTSGRIDPCTVTLSDGMQSLDTITSINTLIAARPTQAEVSEGLRCSAYENKGVTVVDKVTDRRVLPCWMSMGQTVYFLRDMLVAKVCLHVKKLGKYVLFDEQKICTTMHVGAGGSSTENSIVSIQIQTDPTKAIRFFPQVFVSYTAISADGLEHPIEEGGDILPVGTVSVRLEYYGSSLHYVIWATDEREAKAGMYRCISGNAWERVPCHNTMVMPKGSYRRYDVTRKHPYQLVVSEPDIRSFPLKQRGRFNVSSPNFNINAGTFLEEPIDRVMDVLVRCVRKAQPSVRIRTDYGISKCSSRTQYVVTYNLADIFRMLKEHEEGTMDPKFDKYLWRMLLHNKYKYLNADGKIGKHLRCRYVDIAIALTLNNRHCGKWRKHSEGRIYYRLYNKGGGVWLFERQ